MPKLADELVIVDKTKEFNHRTARRPLSKIRYIVVHHTAGSAFMMASQLQDLCVNRGEPGSSYHYFIDGLWGEVTKMLTDATVGEHSKMQNSVSLGVCVGGNYTRRVPSPDPLRSLSLLLEHLTRCYPGAIIVGHREMSRSNTECPGDALFKWLKAWRSVYHRMLRKVTWR